MSSIWNYSDPNEYIKKVERAKIVFVTHLLIDKLEKERYNEITSLETN